VRPLEEAAVGSDQLEAAIVVEADVVDAPVRGEESRCIPASVNSPRSASISQRSAMA
jgi:hypothetical protein